MRSPGFMEKRMVLISLFFFVCGALLVAKLYVLQIADRDRFIRHVRHDRIERIPRKRGSIYDRNGNLLAFSLPAYSLYADPRHVTEKERAVETLHRMFGIDRRSLLRKLSSGRGFEWIRRKLDKHSMEAFKALHLAGFGFRKEFKRYYPNGTLAANVIGFVGMDNIGLEGVECYFEGVLAGVDGEKLVLRGPDGLELPSSELVLKEPEGGSDLYLTIDEVVQHMVERELDEICRRYDPLSAFIIVMDPHTGEVLAMGNRPTYDLNSFASYSASSYKNRAIADIYPPGSVFKIITAAAALEDDKVTPETVFHCPGYIRLWGVKIRCTAAHGDLDLRRILEKSCNTGIIKVGQVVGPENLYYYVRKFGFGDKTGIELPGEQKGIVRYPEHWSGISLGAISMGQEIGVTGIQMACAMCVIANGGVLMRPTVVRRIVSREGRVLRELEPAARLRVISKRTADELVSMLTQVVVRGTGRRGRLDLYTAAGKTGTAQKLGRMERRKAGEPNRRRLVVSFAGFVPVRDPRVVIYIVVDEPRGERVSGGLVAAPAFRELARGIMIHLEVPPDKTSPVAEGGGAPPHEEREGAGGAIEDEGEARAQQEADFDGVPRLDESIAPLPGGAGVE